MGRVANMTNFDRISPGISSMFFALAMKTIALKTYIPPVIVTTAENWVT